ncbi:RNA polymerase sigma factor SigI [Bacillota bacterium]
MREIDKRAVAALEDTQELNCFILENEPYILKCTQGITKRYITKNDDEWSVAMKAFSDAVTAYSYDKGSFLSFAELMIRRRLIDFFRTQNRFRHELSVNPLVFSGEAEEDDEDLFLAAKIASKTAEVSESALKDEIEAVGQQLAEYGFSFYDLITCSPKSKKTKAACAAAVGYMVSSPLLCSELRHSKSLPLKLIEKDTQIPRKVLERHRKYIIAATEILTGDYPGLADYMRPIEGRNIR